MIFFLNHLSLSLSPIKTADVLQYITIAHLQHVGRTLYIMHLEGLAAALSVAWAVGSGHNSSLSNLQAIHHGN